MTPAESYARDIAARGLQRAWDDLCRAGRVAEIARGRFVVCATLADGAGAFFLNVGAAAGASEDSHTWRVPLGATPEEAAARLPHAFRELLPLIESLRAAVHQGEPDAVERLVGTQAGRGAYKTWGHKRDRPASAAQGWGATRWGATRDRRSE